MSASSKRSRREYQRNYKRERRKQRPQICIEVSRPERDTLREIAGKLELSMSLLVRLSALAYLRQTYLVPNSEQVARLEQYLSLLRTDVQRIARRAERGGYNELYWSYKLLMQKIEQLRQTITAISTKPEKLSDR